MTGLKYDRYAARNLHAQEQMSFFVIVALVMGARWLCISCCSAMIGSGFTSMLSIWVHTRPVAVLFRDSLYYNLKAKSLPLRSMP